MKYKTKKKMVKKQSGGICPACLIPIALGAVGMGSVVVGLSKKSKSKKSKSKKSKSKKGGQRIKKGGSPPKKTKRKSLKGRLTRHRKPTPPPPPSPPRTVYEWLFGKGPKPPTPPHKHKPPSLSKKNSKEMKKDPNYNKLSKAIAREMEIPTAQGKFVYKQNSKEKQRHDTKTKNLYNALYQ